MSASLRLGVVAAGLSCLLMGYARAEREIEREVETGTGTVQIDIDTDTESGQTDRARAVQTDRTRAQQGLQHEGQRYTAEFRGAQAAASGTNQQVEQYIVNCLLTKNQGEIEIAKFAEQQTQNPEVKKFAQMLIQDHQQIVQQLQQGEGAAAPRDQSLSPSTQIESQRQTSDTTRLPGSPGAGQQAAPNDIPTIDPNSSLTRDANQALTADRQPGQAGSQNPALQQLMELDRQIAERCKTALKDELQQKQGADFDMAFVGSQVGGHMQMLAALEVLSQQGPERVKQVAQQAQPKVQAHLEHAKQLKEQLASNQRGGTNQAERPQPAGTRTPR